MQRTTEEGHTDRPTDRRGLAHSGAVLWPNRTGVPARDSGWHAACCTRGIQHATGNTQQTEGALKAHNNSRWAQWHATCSDHACLAAGRVRHRNVCPPFDGSSQEAWSPPSLLPCLPQQRIRVLVRDGSTRVPINRSDRRMLSVCSSRGRGSFPALHFCAHLALPLQRKRALAQRSATFLGGRTLPHISTPRGPAGSGLVSTRNFALHDRRRQLNRHTAKDTEWTSERARLGLALSGRQDT